MFMSCLWFRWPQRVGHSSMSISYHTNASSERELRTSHQGDSSMSVIPDHHYYLQQYNSSCGNGDNSSSKYDSSSSLANAAPTAAAAAASGRGDRKEAAHASHANRSCLLTHAAGLPRRRWLVLFVSTVFNSLFNECEMTSV